MPAVDRNILRIGAYELLWGPGVPPAVAISEAVVLAKDLSTDGSAAFVNGLLGRAGRAQAGPDRQTDEPDEAGPAEAGRP